ncbi:NTP transferase domain-containing protein [Spirosoma areae]
MTKPDRNDGPVAPLNGLILTGGRSTRMGQDKSLLTYHDKPQREHLTDLLRPFCDAVFWSVNVDQLAYLGQINSPIIIDSFAMSGPLNGILSAFQYDAKAAWLVVACDMPLLTSQSLAMLVSGRHFAKPATAFYDSDGRFPEPLLSIWEPAIAPILQRALQQGYQSPRQILMLADCHILTAPDVQELLNINDPAGQKALNQRT